MSEFLKYCIPLIAFGGGLSAATESRTSPVGILIIVALCVAQVLIIRGVW